jgi:Protein of unknown function (DUF3015)
MRKWNLVLGLGLMLGAANALADEPAGEKAEGAVDNAHEAVKSETQPAAEGAGVKGSESGGAAKYGPAGCGLGSLIFDANSGWTQIFAATTNGTSGNQTFGITSGTSNCDTGPKKESAKNFVTANRVALAKDISRGKGETLTSLTELAGCKNSQAVGRKLRTSFKQIFRASTVTDEAVGESVVGVLKSDASLSCSNLT